MADPSAFNLVINISVPPKVNSLLSNGNPPLYDLSKALADTGQFDELVTPKIYKWISANDEAGNNYLELLKKYSGPIGDFYNNGGIKIKTKNLEWLKGKKIVITDFRMDEYILDGTNNEEFISL